MSDLYEEMKRLKIEAGEYKESLANESYEEFLERSRKQMGFFDKLNAKIFGYKQPSYSDYELSNLFYDLIHLTPGCEMNDGLNGGVSLRRKHSKEYEVYYKQEIERLNKKLNKI
jgi:hypothetical protein